MWRIRRTAIDKRGREAPIREFHLAVGVRALLVPLALSLFAALPFGTVVGAGAHALADGCSIESHPHGWTSIPSPDFARGSAWLSDYAVDPLRPERMFATNGWVVMRSTDAGCTWGEVYRVGDAVGADVPPHVSLSATVESIVVSGAAEARDRMYLVVSELVDGGALGVTQTRTHVMRSLSGGDPGSWEPADEGLLPLGEPLRLVVAESAPETLYLATALVRLPDAFADWIPAEGRALDGATLVYVSRDAGASWEPAIATGPDAVGLVPELHDIAADPRVPARLWGAGPSGLWRSDDRGDTWQAIAEEDVERPTAFVDIYHDSGSPARIWAFGHSSDRSDDGGSTWNPLMTPQVFTSVAHGATSDHLLATAAGGDWGAAYGFNPEYDNPWIDLRPEGFDDVLRGASADRQPIPTFYAHTRYDIWKYADPRWSALPPGVDPTFEPLPGEDLPPIDEEASTGGCAQATGRPPDRRPPRPANLYPEEARVVLAPGESEEVPYELELPKAPKPVDLFFLIDASESMSPALCGAARGSTEIANELLDSSIHAWFGAGTYQDLKARHVVRNGGGNYEVKVCYAYRRDHDVAPLGSMFVEKLNRIRECGGTEPEMTALHQAATGTGFPPYLIPPSQNANFRPTATPVIVHIADEPRNESVAQQELAIQALQERGIYQVGINLGESYPWLAAVAKGTGAIAEAPVDCNGDGQMNLQPADPLVCSVTKGDDSFGTAMADAVVGSVLALRDTAPVRLVPASDPGGVVTAIQPGVHPGIDLREDNQLPFDVTYTCLPDQAGETFDVELAAEVRDEVVATATALIECLSVEIPPLSGDPSSSIGLAAAPPIIPPPVPPAPALGPAPAPGPAPVSAPGPAPQPQPNPQSQAQPNPQAQAGLAPQKQEQAQTALAAAQQQIAEQEEYSMSARQRRQPSRVPIAAGGAVALAFGCLALRRRSQRAEARWR